MNLPRYALALVASALLAGAAAAQPTTSAPADPSMPSDTTTQSDRMAPPPADTTMAPAATYSATDTSATGATVTTQVVTMQPIPDTPENRAKYGQPLSRAGKHTAPRGN